MKKIFFALILMSSLLVGDVWQDHWQKAEEAMEIGQDKEAYQELKGALSMMSLEESKDNAFIYLLLAEVNIGLENFEEALSNVFKAEEGRLDINDKIKACMTKIIIYVALGKEDERKKEVEAFKEIFTFPSIDHQDKATIIRHVPEALCAKKMISSYLLGTGLCATESDIFFSQHGTCFAKRKQDCGCSGKGAAGSCDYWCDKFDATSQGWCFKHFSNAHCILACVLTVEAIAETCHFCCTGGGFYQNCVLPFADFAEKIGQGCNPDMD